MYCSIVGAGVGREGFVGRGRDNRCNRPKIALLELHYDQVRCASHMQC